MRHSVYSVLSNSALFLVTVAKTIVTPNSPKPPMSYVRLRVRQINSTQLNTEQVAQLSQSNRAAAWVSFGWVVDDGVGQ